MTSLFHLSPFVLLQRLNEEVEGRTAHWETYQVLWADIGDAEGDWWVCDGKAQGYGNGGRRGMGREGIGRGGFRSKG